MFDSGIVMRGFRDRGKGCRLIGRLMVLVFFSLIARSGAAEIVDKIVAVVNDEIISQRELEEKAYPIMLSLPAQPSEEEIARIRKNVMVDLVKNKLVAQAAKQKKIVLDREEVESFVQARMAALEKQYGADLENVLAEQGYSVDEFEDLVRREAKQELIKQRLISQAVEGAVVVTDEDIRTLYSARMLVARTAEDAFRALLQLKSGKITFQNALKQFSSGPGADEGSDMGIFLLGKWSEEIEAELIKLKNNGDFSGVIATDAGYVIVQLIDRRLKPLDEISPDDRKKIRDRIRKLKSVAESDAYVASLWDRAYVKFIE